MWYFLGALAAVILCLYLLRVRLTARVLGLPQATHRLAPRRKEMVPMRDGVALATDIYMPAGEGLFPVLLTRLPYGRRNPMMPLVARAAATRGLVAIVQDTRGRYDSEGTFKPFVHEYDDGLDTVQWIEGQPWFNGSLGMWGGSYFGYTQWAVAAHNPKSLKVIAPVVTSTDFFRLFYEGGPLTLMSALRWGSGVGVQRPRKWWRLVGERRIKKAFDTLPMADMAVQATNEEVRFFRTWATNPRKDAYWPDVDLDDKRAQMDVPALIIAGWYDIFLQPQLDDYIWFQANGATDGARATRLIVGPWAHGKMAINMRYGKGTHPVRIGRDTMQWVIPWLTAGHAPDGKRVRIFVMGDNCWRDEDEWPLARAEMTQYFLHSAGDANDLAGDGLLHIEPPTRSEPPDRFVYDPRRPVPTAGGNFLGPQCGPADQRHIEERPDVLVYSTPELLEDVEVTGPVFLDLWAASSAVDTDFTAKLVDVYPDGRCINIQEGVVRARCRNGPESPPLTPDEPTQFTISLWSTSNVFKRKHRIRLEISSSNFPRWDRHHNTGGDLATSVDMHTAHQVVFHDPDHQSALTLPIVHAPPPPGADGGDDDA